MTESPVKMKGIDRSEVALSSSTISSEESMGGCSVGCFSVSNNRPASADTSYTSRGEGSLGGGVKLGGGAEVVRSESAKSGRHCNSTYKEGRVDNWKCPDPGCKTSNPCGQTTCSNCNLPKHSANQFKRGESKILKQL